MALTDRQKYLPWIQILDAVQMRLNFDQQAEALAPYHAHNWGMDKVVAGEDITRILGEEVQSGTLWGELKYVNIHVWK